MNKLLNLFLLPAICGSAVVIACHTFIGYHHGILNWDMCDHSQTNAIFGLMGFAFGFLPCWLYGMAVNTLADMRLQNTPINSNPANDPAPVLAVGQTFTSSGANCVLRIKVVKVGISDNDLQAVRNGYIKGLQNLNRIATVIFWEDNF